jgi:hypothetical protein
MSRTGFEISGAGIVKRRPREFEIIIISHYARGGNIFHKGAKSSVRKASGGNTDDG